MKMNKSHSRFLKLRNINSGNKHRTRYEIFGIKFTVKNKSKIEFFNNLKEKISIEKYKQRRQILSELKKYRENKEYLLTCYVITYNQEKTIKKCIDSILEQETHYPYLIKILDDGSTDGTFDICLEYAKKYPERVELHTVLHNSGGKMLTVAYEDIETKYFCRIDGDDYWCDSSKIQISLDFLEKNEDYVAYAHDTGMYNTYTKKMTSNIHCWEPNKNIADEISYDNFFYIHVSSRIHRNVLDFKHKYKHFRKRDRVLWYLFLDVGKVYYDDRIMAVYVINSNGFYNKMPLRFQQLSRWLMCYRMNKFFNYKYDECFTSQVSNKKLIKFKKIFGMQLGWEIFMLYLKYIRPINSVFLMWRNLFFQIINVPFKIAKDVKNIDKFTGNFKDEEFPIIQRVRDEII